MAKFRNMHGDVIETHVPAVINDYRMRDGFEEIDSTVKKSKPTAAKQTAKKADDSSS